MMIKKGVLLMDETAFLYESGIAQKRQNEYVTVVQKLKKAYQENDYANIPKLETQYNDALEKLKDL